MNIQKQLQVIAPTILGHDAKILIEGQEVRGIRRVDLTIEANQINTATLEVEGFELDFKALGFNLEISDQTLIAELTQRGYTVTMNDKDIEEELSQGDDEAESQELPGPGGR